MRDVSTAPVIDVVLGQTGTTGNLCNRGGSVSATTLFNPGGLVFDGAGNLFVADHNFEADGNFRLLEFDAGTLPVAPTTAVFTLPANHAWGRNGSFTTTAVRAHHTDPTLCAPSRPRSIRSGAWSWE